MHRTAFVTTKQPATGHCIMTRSPAKTNWLILQSETNVTLNLSALTFTLSNTYQGTYATDTFHSPVHVPLIPFPLLYPFWPVTMLNVSIALLHRDEVC